MAYWYDVQARQIMRRTSKVVREQAAVYLDERDKALLEELAERTGLSRTELFRRGLRRLADDLAADRRPGGSLDRLIESAVEDEFPPDLSERHDEYLGKSGSPD